MKNNPLLILIPTYNEAENVSVLFEQILKQNLKADVVFMDDNSPDGTGNILDELAAQHPQLTALHRSGKLGIGSAHQEGIKYAYEKGYDALITMDCDFTHPPDFIPELIKHSDDCDLVITSRYRLKDSLAGWNIMRKTLTHLGHLLTNIFLKMPYDATGSFRLYKLTRIPPYVFNLVSSQGYSFFYESLYILNINKFKINEIPNKLSARTYGHSKMRFKDAWTSLWFLVAIFLNSMVNKEKFLSAEPFVRDGAWLKEGQGWDEYWQSQKSSNRLFYDAAAAFYRKFIIKRALNYFVIKYFKKTSNVLHAGCGSGQVDTDLREYVSLTGLDISEKALSLYKKIHGDKCKAVYGSIFDLPYENSTVDGIYNLGVMEHFTEEEIDCILKEFGRVLGAEGRLVIFWPPEYGLSVAFFKFLKLIFNKILLKKDVKFHPVEITRIRSKKHAQAVFERNGFKVLRYSFSLRDMFTYAIIVAEKK